MFACVSSFPRIDDVTVYIYVTSCNVLLILCYSKNSYAGILVTGNLLTSILNINYPCISAYAIVMVHNTAHDLFYIGHFLCRVRVVDCCDLRNGAERQWFIVATISGNFFLLKSLLAGTTSVMHRYGPNDTYPCVFNMKRTTYPYLSADFYDAPSLKWLTSQM